MDIFAEFIINREYMKSLFFSKRRQPPPSRTEEAVEEK
jgi:hypothetical protein